MADRQDVTDFLVDHARVSEHVTALIRLLLQKGVITAAEYAAGLQAARVENEPRKQREQEDDKITRDLDPLVSTGVEFTVYDGKVDIKVENLTPKEAEVFLGVLRQREASRLPAAPERGTR